MKKRLFRSRTERMIAGVCGGIAEYFDVDPVWVRLVTALLVLAKGLGVIAYVIAWIIVPEREPVATEAGESTATPAGEEAAPAAEAAPGQKSLIVGGILLALGAVLLIHEFLPWHGFGIFWAIVLIVAGVYLLVKGRGES